MDDIKYIKIVYTNPKSQDKDFLAKKNESESNKKMVDDMIDFDDKLMQAFEIDVDESIKDKILLNTLDNKPKITHKTNVIVMIAASFLLMISVGFNSMLNPPETLGENLLAKVYNNLDYLNRNVNLPIEDLNVMTKDLSIAFEVTIGPINLIKRCELFGRQGVHIVFGSGEDAITLFYFNEMNKTKNYFEDERFKVKTLLAQNGNYVIIGENDKKINELISTLKTSS